MIIVSTVSRYEIIQKALTLSSNSMMSFRSDPTTQGDFIQFYWHRHSQTRIFIWTKLIMLIGWRKQLLCHDATMLRRELSPHQLIKKSRVNRATDEGLESRDQTVICIKKLAGTWMNLIAAVESDVMTWIEIDFYSIILMETKSRMTFMLSMIIAIARQMWIYYTEITQNQSHHQEFIIAWLRGYNWVYSSRIELFQFTQMRTSW